MADELLPCPFCGSEAGDIKLSRGHGYIVGCGMCQGQQFAMSRDEAVALWNARAKSNDFTSGEQAGLRRASEMIIEQAKPRWLTKAEKELLSETAAAILAEAREK